jgi:hypothetical protein
LPKRRRSHYAISAEFALGKEQTLATPLVT